MALMLRLLYGAFVWVPCCVFGLYFPDSAEDYEVLMLLHSGGGISVRDAWLNTSDISGLMKHHRNLTLRELILDGDYRTDLNVDQLPFDEVYMVFLNALADPLWWIAFNGTAVEETKWFQEVTQSSSSIWDYNVTVNISRSSESFYSLYVGTGESDDPAWAAILNSSNLGIPYFIFNADPSMPHEFPRVEKSHDIRQINCSMMKVNFSEENSGILISKYLHLSDLSTNQLYIRRHRVAYLPNMSAKYPYFMSYNMKDCDNTSRQSYIDMLSGNPQEFTTGDLWNTTLIPAVCIWFISNTPQYNFGTHYLLSNIDIELEICVPQTDKYFFPADYLAIIGTYQRSSNSSTENISSYFDGASILNSNPSRLTATGYNDPESSTREIKTDATSTTDLMSDGPSSPILTDYNNPESSTRTVTLAARSTSDLVFNRETVSTIPVNNGIFNSSVTDQSTDVYTAASTDITSSTSSGNQKTTASNANVLCSCACSNITIETLQERLDHIKSILTVDKKALSSTYRKLNCAHDSRLSSKGIGATGLTVLIAIIGIIILMDITKLFQC